MSISQNPSKSGCFCVQGGPNQTPERVLDRAILGFREFPDVGQRGRVQAQIQDLTQVLARSTGSVAFCSFVLGHVDNT